MEWETSPPPHIWAVPPLGEAADLAALPPPLPLPPPDADGSPGSSRPLLQPPPPPSPSLAAVLAAEAGYTARLIPPPPPQYFVSSAPPRCNASPCSTGPPHHHLPPRPAHWRDNAYSGRGGYTAPSPQFLLPPGAADWHSSSSGARPRAPRDLGLDPTWPAHWPQAGQTDAVPAPERPELPPE
jgi:hypothetical protein